MNEQQIISNLFIFLGRVTLEGKEAQAFVEAQAWLNSKAQELGVSNQDEDTD